MSLLSTRIGLAAVSPAISESPWIPFLVGSAGLAIGLGLAYLVTRPKSTAQMAHEMLREREAQKHMRRVQRARRSR